MRASTLSLALFAAASTASSLWQPLEIVKRELEPLRREIDLLLPHRQKAKRQTTTYNLSYSATQGQVDPTTASSGDDSDATATSSGDSSQSSGDSSPSSGGSESATTTARGTGGRTTGRSTANQSTRTFDNRLPAGGVSMITPNAYTTQYYKINDWVTFAWNYTSLSVSPNYIDVLASCSANSATYTIAMNESFAPTQTIFWDTQAYQANATTSLLTETYTLIIYDANKAVSSTPSAGYLGTYDQFTFGMYLPQPYTPISDFVCATCSGALSSLEKNNLMFLVGMAGVTVLSFGWFAGAAGLW